MSFLISVNCFLNLTAPLPFDHCAFTFSIRVCLTGVQVQRKIMMVNLVDEDVSPYTRFSISLSLPYLKEKNKNCFRLLRGKFTRAKCLTTIIIVSSTACQFG